MATSDQPSLIRIQAALVATAVAESFRDRETSDADDGFHYPFCYGPERSGIGDW